eukprot:357179-Chlamydomonas_euryale.AAC.6
MSSGSGRCSRGVLGTLATIWSLSASIPDGAAPGGDDGLAQTGIIGATANFVIASVCARHLAAFRMALARPCEEKSAWVWRAPLNVRGLTKVYARVCWGCRGGGVSAQREVSMNGLAPEWRMCQGGGGVGVEEKVSSSNSCKLFLKQSKWFFNMRG